jgi:hypothetical protein
MIETPSLIAQTRVAKLLLRGVGQSRPVPASERRWRMGKTWGLLSTGSDRT